jgi:glycosyltransferase involved in cell wall biosynthesis
MLPGVHEAPEVTAVIITYNRADLLAQAVDSVLGQTYAHCHALVIDDGSTDATRSLIADRYGGNPRVRYVYQPNGGVAAARNRGIELAQGDYLAFLDSDDLWKKSKIEAQVACLQQLPVGMVWTNMDAVGPDGALVKARYMTEHYGAYRYFPGYSMFQHSTAVDGIPVHWGDVFPAMAMGNMCLPSTLMVSREVALRAGPVDETLKNAEDHDHHWRLSRECRAAYLDTAATLYRIGASDQQTRPEKLLAIAQDTLKTITRALERDPARITLPASMIDRKLAAVHEWIAREQLARGDHPAARAHLRKSLARWPWQRPAWLLLAAACTSPKAAASLRAAYRKMRGRGGFRAGDVV